MLKLDAITLKQLRALRSISEQGSITAASEALHLTAPAVHAQLRALEAALDCRLLVRSGARGATLTAEGKAVLEAAEAVENRLAACGELIRALRSGRTGVVVLGVVSTGKYFAPGLVARIARAFPEIEVILRIGNRDAIIASLQSNTIDLAIMGRPPMSPAVSAHVLGPYPHVLIAAPDHPLAARRDFSAAELLAQTFIAREPGSGTRTLMTRYLDRIGDGAPYRMIEMGTNETVKQAVIARLGVALISQHTVTEELNSGRLVALRHAGLPIERKWFLLHREDLDLTPTKRQVFDLIEGLNGEFLPVLERPLAVAS
ncbi:MAG: LysR family regulator CbbR [Tranquillimonas sp.]